MIHDDCTVECDGCGAPVESHLLEDNYYPTFSDCEFCRSEKTCSGHFVWLHGELDQYGRTKHKIVECSREATVFDTEGREFYCDEGWKIMHEGEDLAEVEEFALRIPEDK